MRSNITMQDLAQQLMHVEQTSRDFQAPSQLISVADGKLDLHDVGQFDLTDIGHKQLAARTGIPAQYYDRMREAGGQRFLEQHVNFWLSTDPKHLTIRTLDNKARAVLGGRYLPVDNYDLLNCAGPLFNDMQLEITALSLTEQRFYMQAISPKLQGEVRVGDIVQFGISIANSEIGMSSIALEEFNYRLVCNNGMVSKNHYKRRHVTRQAQGSEITYAQDTLKADAQALLLTFRDTLRHVVSPANMERQLTAMRGAAARDVKVTLGEVAEITRKKIDLNKGETDNFVTNLAKSGDFTQWGLANAITAIAKDAPPDRAYELEKAGAGIVNMTANQFGVYQKAA